MNRVNPVTPIVLLSSGMQAPKNTNRSPFEPEAGMVTALLEAYRTGSSKKDIEAKLVTLVYMRLQEIALNVSNQLRMPTTLSPSVVCHEAILKLIQRGHVQKFENRIHLYAVFATAVKRYIFDYAKKKNREKHGGNFNRVDFEVAVSNFEEHGIDLFDFYEALDELKRIRPKAGEVAELRFFGGFQLNEIAEALGVSVSTVEARQRFGRAFLIAFLDPGEE